MEFDQILHMTLTRSRLGLLRLIFSKFTAELWPLAIGQILFPHDQILHMHLP